jgi:ankyrin repeat protein
MVDLLLTRSKAKLAGRSSVGHALAWAIRRGHADVVALLQQHGAEVSIIVEPSSGL